MRTYSLNPIGVIRSPYKEKFAVPRQPGLVKSATAYIDLIGEANCLEAVRGLEQFSHLWLLFLFDQHLDAGWKPTVRPPRLGGNQRMGVFASRATFRPNGLGMSAVAFQQVHHQHGQVSIEVGNVDIVDGTPIVDIKPYIPYCDAVPDAIGGYAETAPETIEVVFSPEVQAILAQHPNGAYLHAVMDEVLCQDPRPAYKKNKPDSKEYAVRLFEFDVRFQVVNGKIIVTQL